ncbi:MAG: outer membrane lipoprotein carrier protein LolA [Bacteroidales bacterium]|nr:outer membrane lipoprotein carrier protein LolA [Bacteroidales bacterium]
MKKFSLIISLVVIAASVTLAQEIDRKSKAILDDLSSKIKAYNTYSIEFSYKMENKVDNIEETYTGTILMKKEKYRIEFAEQIIICDGETVWTYLSDANEVQISNAEATGEGLSVSPHNIFSLYEEGHRSKYIREGTFNNTTVHVIELIPLESQVYHKVRLNIEKETNKLLSVVVFDREQTTFTYELIRQQPNLVIPDNKFNFRTENYPGIEIIDLR